MKKMNEYDEVETNTKRIMKHAKEKWVAQTMERVYPVSYTHLRAHETG
jgi:hypothetical protein